MGFLDPLTPGMNQTWLDGTNTWKSDTKFPRLPPSRNAAAMLKEASAVQSVIDPFATRAFKAFASLERLAIAASPSLLD